MNTEAVRLSHVDDEMAALDEIIATNTDLARNIEDRLTKVLRPSDIDCCNTTQESISPTLAPHAASLRGLKNRVYASVDILRDIPDRLEI